MLLVLSALAATIAIGILNGEAGDEIAIEGEPTGVGGVDVASGDIYVHVGGAVRAPGLYRLADGARVVDAVAAALGFADDAVREGVNLARPVTDGEQLIVPDASTPVPAAGSGSGAGSGDGRVNLNVATQTELEELPRIGPALAGRIIAWRETNGRFTSVEDLLAVSGIGAKMLEALRPLVVV